MDLTLDLVLTAGGAVASSALITGLIQLLKKLPGLGDFLDGGRESLAAFLFSAALVATAFAATATTKDIAHGFGAVLAWYGIARLSMGIYDDATKQPGSLTAPDEG